MLIFFLLIIFWSILFIFGWQVSRFMLSEKRIEALIPLAAICGIIIYLSLLVSLSYLIDIQINFYLLLAVFAVLSYFLSRINKKKGKPEWGIDKKWRIIVFATCFLIMLLVAIIGLRTTSAAAGHLDHLPLAASIAQGNFPVRALYAPNYPSQYHYGYSLSLAAISGVTGLPIWFSHDIHNAVFFGLMFLFSFLLIKNFCQNSFKSYLASLVMMLGGNLNFLYAANGLSSLYQKYILNLQISAPFKFFNDMIYGAGELRGGLITVYSNAAWITLGFALTIAVIYLYFRAASGGKNWLKTSFVAGLLFSFLALSAEIFWGALAIVFLIYPIIYAILKKDWQRGKFYLKVSLLVLFLGSFISFSQGGIVAQTIKQRFFGYNFPIIYPFSVTPQYLLKGLIFVDENIFVPIFSLPFFWAWGWLIIFIVPVIIYFIKKYFQLGLFLILLIFVSFFLPLIITAGVSQGNFARFSHLAALSWNLIFGLFLGGLLLSFKKRWQKLLVLLLIFSVILQGTLYFLSFSIFPGLRTGQPFLGREFSKPDFVELQIFAWIKENTAAGDYFLTFGKEPFTSHRNGRFIVYTGRIAPGFFYEDGVQPLIHDRLQGFEAYVPEVLLYQKVEKECDPVALKTLKYRYLYVNENWPQGLEEKCLINNDLELKLQIQEAGKPARIYKILND